MEQRRNIPSWETALLYGEGFLYAEKGGDEAKGVQW